MAVPDPFFGHDGAIPLIWNGHCPVSPKDRMLSSRCLIEYDPILGTGTNKKGVNQHGQPLDYLAGPKGLEPSPSGVTGRRYNQLNYDPVFYLCNKEKAFSDETVRPGSTNPPEATASSPPEASGRRNRTRTCDIHGVSVALSQLSYPPVSSVVIGTGF